MRIIWHDAPIGEKRVGLEKIQLETITKRQMGRRDDDYYGCDAEDRTQHDVLIWKQMTPRLRANGLQRACRHRADESASVAPGLRTAQRADPAAAAMLLT